MSFWNHIILSLSLCFQASAPGQPSTTKKILKSIGGSLIFHEYSSYDELDSRIFLLDLQSYQATEISKNWDIISPMNAHISSDGKFLTFMGIRPDHNTWSVYLWDFNSQNQPKNIAENLLERHEDPKFSSDCKKIVFKCDGDLCEYHMTTKSLTKIYTSETESSMPYYSEDAKSVIFSAGAGADASIQKINLETQALTILHQTTHVQEYYPIVINEQQYFYVRWASRWDHQDQIHIGNFTNGSSAHLPIDGHGDHSDPYPVDERYLFYSLNPSGGKGYEIHIADLQNGRTYQLPKPILSGRQALGACHTPFQYKI